MALPDFTTQDAASYKANIDESVAIYDQVARAFYVHEAATPDMTVVIKGGHIQNGTILTSVAQQTTAAFTAPTTNPRIDRVVIDKTTGAYSVIAGTEAASPVAPALTANKFAVADILLAVGDTAIANSMITDRRASILQLNAVDTDATLAANSDTLLASQKAVKGYVDAKLVMLSTPELLTTDTTNITATAVNSATLNTAKAVMAIISVQLRFVSLSTFGELIYFASDGSAMSGDNEIKSRVTAGTGGVNNTKNRTEFTVGLDGSYNYTYKINDSNPSIIEVKAYLVGYYV